MPDQQRSLKSVAQLVVGFIIFIWLVEAVERFTGLSFSSFGVLPRTWSSVSGILTMPLIHSDWEHLLANTGPLALMGGVVLFLYQKVAWRAIAFIWLGAGALTWLIARGDAYHIGASGVIYGLAGFLVTYGILRREMKSIAIACFVVFLYGGMWYGVLPGEPGVSWEGHLAGALSGIVAATAFKNVEPRKQYAWESEPEEEEDHFADYVYLRNGNRIKK